MRAPRLPSLTAAALLLTLGAGPAAAQAPIKIGDINSYSGIGAPFTGPYRAGVEMAVEEINAKGGVLGRKIEVLFRDDKGQPAEAVKHAQELVESDKVAMITGSFLSNVGLAVSDWAKQNKTMFLAAEPLTEALTWSKGHDYVVRLRPNTYEQGRMLADKAGKMKYVKWATIGPNYEYGKRAWETFRDRLKELKPDVQVVGEHWPTLGKIEPGPLVTAILNQNPDALYVSLFGSDWLAFVREAGKRGLFQKMFVVGILLGEPEYIDPLKLEAPEGMLVTGYPWYDIKMPEPPGVGRPLRQARGQEPGAGLADRLRHLPVGGGGPPEGGRAPRPRSWSPPSRASRSRRRSGRSPSAPPTASPRWARGWARPRSTPSGASASWSTTSTSRARRCCRPTTK